MRRTTNSWLIFLGAALLFLIPSAGYAQHCRLHYTQAFELIAKEPLTGRSPTEIKQTVDNLFGPRQENCGENSYKFFLSQLETQTSAAFRKKGVEQESRLLAMREILLRMPLLVRFNEGSIQTEGLVQLRANLAVLSKEVGSTPAIQNFLVALAQVAPPKANPRPMAKDDDAIPIVVPKVPLPAWALISLYEIRDHAQRKENGEIINKTNLILDWVARVNAGARPEDLQVAPLPSGATPPKPAPSPAR